MTVTYEPFCSFCGRHKDFVKALVAAPKTHIYICDECVRLSLVVVDDFLNKKNENDTVRID